MDLCNLKCSQERRIIKKDLSVWSKKFTFLLGLEEVTRSTLGKRLSRKLLDPIPFLRRERAETVDWDPSNCCAVCIHNNALKQKQLALNAKKHKSNISTTKEKYANLREDNQITNSNDLCQRGPVKATLSQPSNHPFSGDYSNPNEFKYGTNHHFPTQDFAHYSQTAAKTNNKRQNFDRTIQRGQFTGSERDRGAMFDPDAPLDLSLSSASRNHENEAGEEGFALKVPKLEDKLVSNKKPESSGCAGTTKRPYTEADLTHALHEVRSGKLGTRRAAMLYGIPRSTLRNNIGRSGHTDSPKSDLKEHSHPVLDEKTLAHIRHKHDLNAGIDRPFGWPPLFYDDKYIRECERAFQEANPYAYDMKVPFLHDLIMQYAQERMDACNDVTEEEEVDQSSAGDDLRRLPNGKAFDSEIKAIKRKNSDLDQDIYEDIEARRNIISNHTPMLTEAFTSAIAKSFQEKLLQSNGEQVSPNSRLGDIPTQPVFPQPCDSFYLPLRQETSPVPSNNKTIFTPQSSFKFSEYKHEAKKAKLNNNNTYKRPSKAQSSNTTSLKEPATNSPSEEANKDGANKATTATGAPGKKSRPKRGQYRKYNHELLLEAVKAVQRGEMSVHRAGSYYGVPHSTLEYKVKERHLLRQKKPREPRGNKKQGGEITTSPNSIKKEESLSSPDRKSPEIETKFATTNIPDAMPFPSPDGSVTGPPEVGVDSSAALAATEALHKSLFLRHMGSLGALPGPLPSGFPGFPPLPLGWPPAALLNGGVPTAPLPDPALLSMLAAGFGAARGASSPPTSASDLLKKLQAKVQADIISSVGGGGAGEKRGEADSIAEAAGENKHQMAPPMVQVGDK